MRLRELKLRNIASLKGEHHVDFRDIESRSYLFAITGETGAGKSSLLNSIGLALYGQVFKRSVNQNDLVTLGEKEGEIQLLFEVKGRPYLASWRARVLKSNGEPYATPQSPTRELYELETPGFDSGKTISSKKVEDLLNLDFDQFCKCIILNQGEFARFLLSTFNERKEILEKLYPGEVLENVSKELKQELDTLDEEKLQIDAALSALSADGADLETLDKERSTMIQRLERSQVALDQLKKISTPFSSAQTYHQNHADYALKKSQIQNDVEKETLEFNQVLKKNEAALTELQEARMRLRKEEPFLLQLLEKELSLKNAEDGARKTKSELDQIEISVSAKRKSLSELSALIENNQQEIELFSKTFLLPIESTLQLKDQFSRILEVWREKEHLNSEGELRNGQFKEVEARGLKITQEVKALEETIEAFPKEIPQKLELLVKKKSESQALKEKRQKWELEYQKIKEDEALTVKEAFEAETKEAKISEDLKSDKTQLLPLQTTLKLQEVLMAVKTCLTHPESRQKGECPVCESQLSPDRWDELKSVSEKNDFESIKIKVRELESRQIALTEEQKHLRALKKKCELTLNELREREKILAAQLKTPLESELSLDEEIERLKKEAWEHEKTSKELQLRLKEREETREKYRHLRDLIQDHAKRIEKNSQVFSSVAKLWTDHFQTELKLSEIEKIRDTSTKLPQYLDLLKRGEALIQDRKLQEQMESQLAGELQKKTNEFKSLMETSNELRQILKKEVGDSKVSELLEKLRTQGQLTQEAFDKSEQALKSVQSRLKDLQGRIFSYDEQMKAAETMFTAQISKVREESRHDKAFAEDERDFFSKLTQTSLSLSDVSEIFSPVADRLLEIEARLKDDSNESRSRISSLETLKSEMEKRLDRIKLLQLKHKDLNDRLQRLKRLSEVLGRDELRSFVLSMVEENLIHQTNVELGRLCQGRYEIVHQNRGKGLTPEFYILDKFREGQRRKVSTLSGGETFMVSLAMALGLAEMTRGQAEIDSLFIDEGFGTLDEESLEDVMEMLNQIQTRGLLVGVISHVKALTRSMPVNLNLSKKSDGTSTIGIRIN